ncbi:hypothetical protein GALMADRAFT_207430 [Galerina marginata CBS 339.88]|uniref:AIG1-type G domain-containing protein n=1 Tax=Galerina marginata (strain CBS 339.88) TaxID=685588 RepID=A0A067TFW7_GALM3|nr:hypothetical protein GALMADRAFT_207430 [Galerina marginata CBS 339.88]
MSNRRNGDAHTCTKSKITKQIVIPFSVMGPTGAGKSTFINALLQDNSMKVGHKLRSCTKDLSVARINSFPGLPSSFHLLIVDTPGFDDTFETDEEVLRCIAEWLKKAGMSVGGVIYLHDVSIDRFTGTAQRNLEMLEHMCGEAALPKVILGTTKWAVLSKPEIASAHEAELQEQHWLPLTEKGSTVQRFEDTHESAKTFLDTILLNFRRDNLCEIALQIQHELAVDKKIIPETEAGKKLRYTLRELKEIVEEQKRRQASKAGNGDPEARASLDELQQKIEKIKQQIRNLKIPIGRRLRSFLGF